ncbi:MAG: Glu-tRNA(Gln) amidotransferase subunit GatD [Candidatus Nitrosocaldus sp.]
MEYRGKAHRLLDSCNVKVGDRIVVKTRDSEYRGILMPRYELADDRHLIIKLSNGYNIGVSIDGIVNITLDERREDKEGVSIEGRGEEKSKRGDKRDGSVSLEHNATRAKLALVSTGGTIASRIDYRTGGVRAALTAEELYSIVPELSSIAAIDTEVLMQEYSENLTPMHWSIIAERVGEKISEGYDGIVIAHGTDTMHYTSSALSFALQNLPVPVVLVGAQRSSDRPSSDAATNLIGASLFATIADASGVFIAMHEGKSDDRIAVHIGTRVRKNHTSSRDAFESIDTEPIALVYVDSKRIDMLGSNSNVRRRDKSRRPMVRSRFDEHVALIKFYPGLDPSIIEHLISKGYRGLVLEGTGLGHVSKRCFNAIKDAIDSKMLVCMTSQCIWGRLRMTVYETGRDLLSMGVIPLDMLPETALVKVMWVLANSSSMDEARSMLLSDIAMEFK